MQNLLRREYEHPDIAQAVAQVLLDWNASSFETFCHSVRKEAEAAFLKVNSKTQHTITASFGAGVSQAISNEFGGLSIVPSEGGELIIEQSGFRASLPQPYPGRKRLLELIDWVAARLPKGPSAVSVSVLYESMIRPDVPEGEIYQIQDYIVPRFEFADPNLNLFSSFRHDVFLDMKQLAEGPFRGRCILSSAPPGISVLIDVLDDAKTPISSIRSRLKTVKDLETHIFESTITEKTRNLYGILHSKSS